MFVLVIVRSRAREHVEEKQKDKKKTEEEVLQISLNVCDVATRQRSRKIRSATHAHVCVFLTNKSLSIYLDLLSIRMI